MKKQKLSAELAQLRRLIGQLTAVEKMIFQKAKTSEILQQLEAARGNLKALEMRILAQNLKKSGNEELRKACFYLFKLS